MDSWFAKNNPLVILFQNFVWQSWPRAKISGRCYYLLTIPCTLSRMQGFTCLIKSYKTNMLRLFQWNTVRRRITYLCFVVHLFFKDSSCLSCCGVTGNSPFPGSAVKYLENISHSFSSPELLMCTPLTSLVSNKGFITVPCLLNSMWISMKSNVPSLIHIFFKKPLTWFDVSFILIRCCLRPFRGSILHTAICDFGKVCFIL